MQLVFIVTRKETDLMAITKTYQITNTTGNEIIDAGSDLAQARVLARSYADKWGTEAYLCERGATEDAFETFPRKSQEYCECDSCHISTSEHPDDFFMLDCEEGTSFCYRCFERIAGRPPKY